MGIPSPTELVTCHVCRGHGELDTGKRESGTNAIVTERCETCSGSGEIPFIDSADFLMNFVSSISKEES